LNGIELLFSQTLQLTSSKGGIIWRQKGNLFIILAPVNKLLFVLELYYKKTA